MHTKSIEETDALAEQLIEQLTSAEEYATVLALEGDLGSGKTTFTKALAGALGIGEIITSPTFVIMKLYETTDARFTRLVHIDAYRLESGAELDVLGFRELLSDPQTLIVIEWPERVSEIMPEYAHTLTFAFIDEHTRDITLPETIHA